MAPPVAPATAALYVTFVLAGDISDLGAFEADFKSELATYLGISASRIFILAVTSASIIVDVKIIDTADSDGVSTTQIDAQLESAFASGQPVAIGAYTATGITFDDAPPPPLPLAPPSLAPPSLAPPSLAPTPLSQAPTPSLPAGDLDSSLELAEMDGADIALVVGLLVVLGAFLLLGACACFILLRSVRRRRLAQALDDEALAIEYGGETRIEKLTGAASGSAMNAPAVGSFSGKKERPASGRLSLGRSSKSTSKRRV